MGKIINFAKATRAAVLQSLEDALRDCPGCAPPEISYTLFKRVIDSGVGEIVSPLRINREAKDSLQDKKYVHSLSVNGICFSCYSYRPIDREGNFIDPSQLPESQFDWPKTSE